MTLGKAIAAILILLFWGPLSVRAQPIQSGDSQVGLVSQVGTVSSDEPALNLLFSVKKQWALYGAPQTRSMSSSEWEALVDHIRKARFETALVQVVVIMRDSDVKGTIGLVDRLKGRRVKTKQVGQDGATAYDIWRTIGYRTTARKIFNAHKENVLAIDRYRNMPVILTSRVRRVSSDPQGLIYVELKVGRDPSDGTLSCYPWAEAPQMVDLTTLTEGDNIKVTCQIASFSGEILKMTSCLFSQPELRDWL